MGNERDAPSAAERRRWDRLAIGAIAGVVVFDLAWLLLGAVERDGYSVGRDDVSDLTALTSHHAPLMLVAGGVAGVLTILFALGALRPALAVPGRGTAIGAWLLAASLMGLDNVSDAFFRLDCRAADPGCTVSVAAASWHGTIHVAVAVISAVATIAMPFALAHRMRRTTEWEDLARPAFVYGFVFVVVAVFMTLLERHAGGGLAQRAAIVLFSAGLVAVALRVRALARTPAPRPRNELAATSG
jgi:hypothetical protein